MEPQRPQLFALELETRLFTAWSPDLFKQQTQEPWEFRFKFQMFWVRHQDVLVKTFWNLKVYNYCAITKQQNLKNQQFSKTNKDWVLKMIDFYYFGVWAQLHLCWSTTVYSAKIIIVCEVNPKFTEVTHIWKNHNLKVYAYNLHSANC